MKIHHKFCDYEVHAYCQLISVKITNNHMHKPFQVFTLAWLDRISLKKPIHAKKRLDVSNIQINASGNFNW